MEKTSIMDNRRIARNSFLLYVRMLFLTLVSLYTSRILISSLGVQDYGIYNVVGGIVVIFSFVSGSLSSAVQRFISFEIGKKDFERLKEVFDSSITIFTIIGLLLFILIELFGLYMLNFRLNIPEDRMLAANWVFQFSVLTFFINIISVPYNSAVIAHEKMDVYAYVSIAEFTLKLIAALLLNHISGDNLILYSVLIFLIAIFVRISYKTYCRLHLIECKSVCLRVGKATGKAILSYSGWNIIGSLATILKQQGVNLVQNIFFGPVVNTAHAISMQIASALTMFTNNVFLATRPSITKLYACNEMQKMWNLVFSSTRYALLLFIIVIIPLYYEIPMVLNLWLGNVPPITIGIVKLLLLSISVEISCSQIFAVFQASNKLRTVQIFSSSIILLIVPASYFLLKADNNPLIPYIVWLVCSFLFTIVTLMIAHIEIDLNIKKYFVQALFRPICIAFVVFPCTYWFISVLDTSPIRLIYTFFYTSFLSVILIMLFGLTRNEMKFIIKSIKNKIYGNIKKNS